MKKKSIFAVLLTSCFFTASVLALVANNGDVPFSRIVGNDSITVTLDSTNAPTQSSSFVAEVVKEESFSTYVYKKVKASSGKLCELDAGGSISKVEASGNLASITVNFTAPSVGTFTNNLALYTKYDEADEYSTYYTLSNGVEYSVGGNYFKLATATGVIITSITLKYECTAQAPAAKVPFEYLYSPDSGSSYTKYVSASSSNIMATVDRNGLFRMEAENTESEYWTIKAGQSTSVDTSEGAKTYSSNKACIMIGKYSRYVFPFKLNQAATVTIHAAMSYFYDNWLDNQVNIHCALDSQILETPAVQFGHGSTTVPEAYFIWKDCNYGTYELSKGYHVIVFQSFNELPNFDYVELNVANYNISHSYTKKLTENTTYNFRLQDFLGHGSTPIKDRNWLYNKPGAQERHTISGETRHSAGGLSHGTDYILEFNMLNEGDVLVSNQIATQTAMTLNSDNVKLLIDNTEHAVTGSVTLGQGWHTWQTFDIGTYHLTAGNHHIRIVYGRIANILEFNLTVSNMETSFLQINGNGTEYLEAEDDRIDRSGWNVRADWEKVHPNQPWENWSNSGATPATSATSGKSLAGLGNPCPIALPFVVNGNCDLEFQVIVAYTGGKPCNSLTITLDGVTMTGNDTELTMRSDTVSTYWYWLVYRGGVATNLEAGYHTIVATVVGGVNIDSFRFVTTNYSN